MGREDDLGGLGGQLAAGSEAPAWTITGQPCTGRAMLSGPRTDRCSPLWSSTCILAGIEDRARSRVADEGVVGEAVPEPGDHVVELARPIVALAMLHMLVEAEIQRASGLEVVTMFQPARPPLIWSSEAKRRAT
jgi:hypothetical protein